LLFSFSLSYLAVNPTIGLKRRGSKGRVELKVMTEGGIAEDGGIKGIEHWKKYKASVHIGAGIRSLKLMMTHENQRDCRENLYS
jgi:hypothetical protein